jgi:hypothetical protein
MSDGRLRVGADAHIRPVTRKEMSMFSASGMTRAFSGIFAAFRRVLRLGKV